MEDPGGDRRPSSVSPSWLLQEPIREALQRHGSFKHAVIYARDARGSSLGSISLFGGTRTSSLCSALVPQMADMTRHLSLTRLKDLTSLGQTNRSREVTFTVPPSISPLSPRRPLGEGSLSPMSPRRTGSGETTPVGSIYEFGADIRGNVPAPIPSRPPEHSFPGAWSLGTLNPDLYKNEELEGDVEHYPEDHIGRVWFQLEFISESEKLLITLIKAKNLPSRTAGSINCCDPFVRLYLMPDERRYLQTRTKKKTCNPRFDEAFGFQVTGKELEERALKLTFFDVDRDKKHQVIGHVVFLLKDYPYLEGKKTYKRDLTTDMKISPNDAGEIELTLCYNENLERIVIIVGGTRNLKIPEEHRQPLIEFQARISLLQQTKVIKTKKSSIIKTEEMPDFHESFHFKLISESLNTTVISVQLQCGKKTDAMIGKVQLGSFMFTRGKGLEHWEMMLSKKKEHVHMWHSLIGPS